MKKLSIKKSRSPRLPLFLAPVLLVLGLWIAGYVVKLVFPFQSWNPFEREITVGQNVSGQWKYGGLDANGHVLFYNHFNTVSIPKNQNRFDVDGDYILFSDPTSDTLMIESHEDFLFRTSMELVIILLFLFSGVWLLLAWNPIRSKPFLRHSTGFSPQIRTKHYTTLKRKFIFWKFKQKSFFRRGPND